jgi:hypothetical protein
VNELCHCREVCAVQLVIGGRRCRRSNWYPIETAPKDKILLGFWKHLTSGEGRCSVIQWLGSAWCSPDDMEGDELPVTHWMSLPEPPK